MKLVETKNFDVNILKYLFGRLCAILLLIVASSTYANAESQPEITATKEVSNSSPIAGDTLTYTLTITNTGDETAFYIFIEDILQQDIHYIPDSISGGSVRDDSDSFGQRLTWSIDALDAGATMVLTYEATVGVKHSNSEFYDPEQ